VGNTGAMFVKIKIRQGLYRYLTVFCFDLTPQAEVPDDKILEMMKVTQKQAPFLNAP
jgi:hypothetical protein